VDEVNSDVPAELADVIDRLLSKSPADRFRDTTQLEHRLETILVQLQSGKRSSRLRIRRTWLRWRNAVRYAVAALLIATVCVAVGTTEFIQ